MNITKRVSICFLGAIILMSPCFNVPSMSFGEPLSTVSVSEENTKIKPSSQETKKKVVSSSFRSTGFRSEESEVEHSSDEVLPLPSALSTEEEKLVETTDASGGTMINLQGRFQSVLRAPSETIDKPVEGPLPPVVP